jgi:hypothetical protein
LKNLQFLVGGAPIKGQFILANVEMSEQPNVCAWPAHVMQHVIRDIDPETNAPHRDDHVIGANGSHSTFQAGDHRLALNT